MPRRRETLKIMGAVGSTCAFPFQADELYGQHEHAPGAAPAPKLPTAPSFFTAAEFETITRLADLIIPRTNTPGALDAGVPAYVDYVVSRNKALQQVMRDGLAWLDQRAQGPFVKLPQPRQLALLRPLDRMKDKPRSGDTGLRFFQAAKGLIADGYYTSREGLLTGLGYQGNTVMAEFPTCLHEH